MKTLLSKPLLALETYAPQNTPSKPPWERPGGPAPFWHLLSAAAPRTRRGLCVRPGGAASHLGSLGGGSEGGGTAWEGPPRLPGTAWSREKDAQQT